LSAAEVGNLSHEITSLAAASSARPLREGPACVPAAGFLAKMLFHDLAIFVMRSN